jgi:hypothetical protein
VQRPIRGSVVRILEKPVRLEDLLAVMHELNDQVDPSLLTLNTRDYRDGGSDPRALTSGTSF